MIFVPETKGRNEAQLMAYFAKKKKITPEEFTQILIDSHEEVGINKKQLQVLKKTLSEMDE